ncbi:uncharacterized protein LOC119675470 [Teleopsis dalmanni]|uniref:uncharacterized protein LOC119675470 n=1 Tax=Teleopsis dalmanni TaxID=139649 RepID=UPI0018CD0103|nr:uncharacterized protein LOC119675470 [Teleopsis dalmanni]
MKFISLVIVAIACFILVLSKESKREWSYVFLGIKGNSTNTSLIDTKGKAERISRGLYGISGYHTMHKDVLDDNYFVEVKIYCSFQGNDNLHLTPFYVPPTNVLVYANVYFKKYLMRSTSNCSNLPLFGDNVDITYADIPLNITLSRCLLNISDFPSFVQKGYYRILTSTYRTKPPFVNAFIMIDFKVDGI